MTNIILTLAYLFVLQTPGNDLSKMNLKGKVKMVKEKSFFYPTDENNADLINTYLFNEKGYFIESKTIMVLTSINQTKFYKYDSLNRLKKEFLVNNDCSSECEYYIEYEYDSNKMLLKQSNLDSNGNKDIVYHYKNNKNDLTSVMYIEGNTNDSTIYKFDDHGNILQTTCYERGEITTIYRDFFNSNNQLITEDIIMDGETDTQILKYNNNADLIESTRFDASGKIKYSQKFKYKYDEMNNWILKEEYILDRDKLNSKTKRTIEYFK